MWNGEATTEIKDFKHLRSTVQSDRECGKKVKKSVQAG